MKYYNGIPVGDGVLLGKKTPHAQFSSEDCSIFMTYEQLQKKWNKKNEVRDTVQNTRDK